MIKGTNQPNWFEQCSRSLLVGDGRRMYYTIYWGSSSILGLPVWTNQKFMEWRCGKRQATGNPQRAWEIARVDSSFYGYGSTRKGTILKTQRFSREFLKDGARSRGHRNSGDLGSRDLDQSLESPQNPSTILPKLFSCIPLIFHHSLFGLIKQTVFCGWSPVGYTTDISNCFDATLGIYQNVKNIIYIYM